MDDDLAIAVLRDALQFLDNGNQWLKGKYGNADGNVCSAGAIMLAGSHNGEVTYIALKKLSKVICEQYPGYQNPEYKYLDDSPIQIIGMFNDMAMTKWDDIRVIFEKAIAS